MKTFGSNFNPSLELSFGIRRVHTRDVNASADTDASARIFTSATQEMQATQAFIGFGLASAFASSPFTLGNL